MTPRNRAGTKKVGSTKAAKTTRATTPAKTTKSATPAKMTKAGTTHVVVDGSNIATEGRSKPSLQQLNDAVLAYVGQHSKSFVTVVVDATFGHRIDASERSEFDEAIANNELVAPPAGAIGRGDAFILGIADKAGAVVLSNDSFQEFHGQYPWLFEPGRLIGGKPVPHVGWVFVERMPVRGPTSRRAVRASDQGVPEPAASRRASKAASLPMPTPKTPPPGRVETPVRAVNEILPFLDFAEHHVVGSRVRAIVHSYSSHGAYVRSGDVKLYVPLRLMGSPPPPKARQVMSIGDTVEVEIVEFAPVRCSIDCALVEVFPSAAGTKNEAASASSGTRQSANKAGAGTAGVDKAISKKLPAKKTATKKVAAKAVAAKRVAAKRVPVKKVAATKAAAKKVAAKKIAAKKVAAKKIAAKKAGTKRAK